MNENTKTGVKRPRKKASAFFDAAIENLTEALTRLKQDDFDNDRMDRLTDIQAAISDLKNAKFTGLLAEIGKHFDEEIKEG